MDINNSQQEQYTLGIFCYFHDSSACILQNGSLVAFAEEERFNRQKHTYQFPLHSIEYCLAKANIPFSQVTRVAYGFKPWKFLLNQLISATKNFPQSFRLLRQGSSYMPLTKKITSLLGLDKELAKAFGNPVPPITYVDHHASHAYAAYFASPFNEAAVFIMDGFGETFATSFYRGEEEKLNRLKIVPYPHSLGVFYGAMTQFLGFKPHHDEYKVMGMAAYGEDRYGNFFRQMLSLNGAWGFQLNIDYISLYTHGISRWFSGQLEKELGPRRNEGDPFEQRHFDIARSVQRRFEEVVLNLGKQLQQITESKNLCVAGGCAQNVLANRVLLDRCGFENIFIPPIAYDSGVSLGSALALSYQINHHERNFILDRADWGPHYSNEACERVLKEKGLAIDSKGDVIPRVAELLAQGKIIGFFDGGMEMGPRALGNRSILADPRQSNMMEILNARIKKREFFRPFAAVVTWEDCQTYFDLPVESPFMTLVGQVKKLDLLPAVTHKDGSVRIQTVKREQNKSLYRLLKEFQNHTTIPVLLNTSFNENEPIVCCPEEAIDCFKRTHMDALVFNGRLLVLK